MKIYGRTQKNSSKLSLLAECTFVAEPEALREIASFLYRCADNIEEQGESWEHDTFESNEVVCPGFIVFNPYVVEDEDS
ncbi:MAG: hypothetical protein EXR84_02905 [Gammaproteobacteria bacterium]|nr:hypothetical protein [Gammaproteobacteria bacterium]